jgi:hypothetical protein
MASIVDMANEEADRVEAENPDEETPDFPDEPEPEPEPEPEAEPVEAIGPDEIRRAEKASEAQRRKLAAILGEAFVAHDCPLCAALGFLPELPAPGARFEFVTDGENAGFAILPPETPPELKHAPDKGICDECDGWGEVITGARNPNTAIWQCSKCNGNGYVTVIREQPAYQLPPVTTSPGGLIPAPADVGLPPDAWGRPAGHPHYGLLPSQVS